MKSETGETGETEREVVVKVWVFANAKMTGGTTETQTRQRQTTAEARYTCSRKK